MGYVRGSAVLPGFKPVRAAFGKAGPSIGHDWYEEGGDRAE